MRPVLEACVIRSDVLKGDLEDALFAADFGHVIEGRARGVYQEPVRFFQNTHPARELKKIVEAIFGRLADPKEPGVCLRLSTGFGGGKTHALIALWHLARNAGNPTLGAELLAPDKRPPSVRVAGVDGEQLGYPVARDHPDARPRSLWGELAYQLGGTALLSAFQTCDDAEASPSSDLIRKLLDWDEPVLILLDEIVKYMAKLPEGARKNIVAFVGALISEVVARPQTALVITDPATQGAYAEEAYALARADRMDSARRLDQELGRKASDYDPIGSESARVIARRLFETIDSKAADEAASTYVAAYKRIVEASPDALPPSVATEDYAARIRECYPFHPRFLDTAQNRLGAMPAFNKSRGTLRLFARILRQLEEAGSDLPLITAGDVDLSADRIQADLLQRLDREQYKAAVEADCIRHASELDKEIGGDMHRRVAAALLIESLPNNDNAAMDRRDVTLATLRPSEVGHEPGEALDRLCAVSWYLFPVDAANRYRFKAEPNINKRIEEVAETIARDEALQRVLAHVQNEYSGGVFKPYPFPDTPRAVPDSAELKLVLCESEEAASRICDLLDDSDPANPQARPFRNAIVALASTRDALEDAVRAARRLIAAETIKLEMERSTNRDQSSYSQLQKILPPLTKETQFRACRAFTRVVLQGRSSVTLDEKYLVSYEEPTKKPSRQAMLAQFLEDKGLMYRPDDTIDLDLLCDELLPGATPSEDHEGAVTAKSIHERALSSPKLRLLPKVDPVREAILRGVREGRLAVRLANGECYDSRGCVSGPDGSRRRDPARPLTKLSLTADVLVAPMKAPCVAKWFAVSDAESEQDLSFVPEPPQASYRATNWEEAIVRAREARLTRLTLKASDAGAARKLAAVAAPFGARDITLEVRVDGELKDGGRVTYDVTDAKMNSQARPLDRAAEILRAVKEDEADYEAALTLDFGEDGLPDAAGVLEQASQKAEGIAPEAEFKPEDA